MTNLLIDEWVSASKAGVILGCQGRQVPKLAESGLIRVRRLPGCFDKYALADVVRLAETSVITAPAK